MNHPYYTLLTRARSTDAVLEWRHYRKLHWSDTLYMLENEVPVGSNSVYRHAGTSDLFNVNTWLATASSAWSLFSGTPVMSAGLTNPQ